MVHRPERFHPNLSPVPSVGAFGRTSQLTTTSVQGSSADPSLHNADMALPALGRPVSATLYGQLGGGSSSPPVPVPPQQSTQQQGQRGQGQH